jgi:hypothetical protein
MINPAAKAGEPAAIAATNKPIPNQRFIVSPPD